MTDAEIVRAAGELDLDALEVLLEERREYIAAGEWKRESAVEFDIAMRVPALIARIRELEALTEWRSIEDGLPEDRVNVLVWDGQSVLKGFQRGGYWYGDGLVLSRKVTHWRPLSAGPEGE